jgi:2-polyprenyl-6-methoxyphenol hydroxylase-like FAD-dependent oxidoreductase
MMLGFLLARAGVKAVVLEKHGDFLRDFRGDTVHPSTLNVIDELGLLDEFLKLPHQKVSRFSGQFGEERVMVADFSHLPVRAPYIAMMPQWDFLDFLRDEAKAYPGFGLQMEKPVESFVIEGERVTGVRLANGKSLKARLVIAADGRSSIARGLLPLEDLGAPMDVFWFRVGKKEEAQGALRGNVEAGRLLVMIDRGDYWQCAFLIPKGAAEAYQARGIAAIREEVAAAAPQGLDLSELDEISDLHLLTVKLDRLVRWHKPGLLAIGDAAHAMSPIGGIGINLAIQDAVASANILAGPLAAGEYVDELLGRVQKRREWPTRVIQAGQKAAQDRIIGRILQASKPISQAPFLVRMLDRYPLLRRIPGRIIGLGVRRERVLSPNSP